MNIRRHCQKVFIRNLSIKSANVLRKSVTPENFRPMCKEKCHPGKVRYVGRVSSRKIFVRYERKIVARKIFVRYERKVVARKIFVRYERKIVARKIFFRYERKSVIPENFRPLCREEELNVTKISPGSGGELAYYLSGL